MDNVLTWVRRLPARIPLTAISVETVRFDTQLMEDATISGVAYQQGTLAGYEVREYLLERWQRTCAYCHATGVSLQIEHMVPRSGGGTDRVSNLTLIHRADGYRYQLQAVRGLLVALDHPDPRLNRIPPAADAAGFLRRFL